MDYGRVVSQGWKITWENKYLWVLGFLAALTSSRANSSSSNSSSSFDPNTLSPEELVALGGAFVAVVCVSMAIGLILWVVGLIARGGLITAVYKISSGKEMTLGQAFSAGVQRIWPIIGMNLLLYLPFFLIGMAAIVVVFMMAFGAMGTSIAAEANGDLVPSAESIGAMMAGLGTFLICFVLLCCVLFILGICLNFINAFAYRGIMIHKMGVMESISHSWELIKVNFAEVLILSILFGVIGLIISFAIAVLFVPIALVVMAPVIAGGISGELSAISLAYGVGAGLCLGVLGAIITAVLVTWQSATFTLAYKEWTKKMGFVGTGTDDIDDLDDIVEKSPA